MNEELKNRFDALSSSSDNEHLTWEAMGPSIQDALQKQQKKRRGVYWWWVGGASALLLIAFLAIQHQISRDAVSSVAEFSFDTSSSSQELIQNQDSKAGFGEDLNSPINQSGKGENELFKDVEISNENTSAFAKTADDSNIASGILKVSSNDQVSDSHGETQGIYQHEVLEQNGERIGAASSQAQQSKAVSDEPKTHSFSSIPVAQNASVARDRQRIDDVSYSQNHTEEPTQVLPKGEGINTQTTINLSEGNSLDFLAPLGLSSFAIAPIQLDATDLPNVFPPASDEVAAPDRPSSALYVAAFGGGQLGNAAEAYQQAKNFLGLSVGLGLEYELASGWFGGIGFRMDRTHFSTEATLLDTIREYRPGQVERVYSFSNNEIILEYSDSISVQLTRNIVHYNTQTDLVLPVHLGYRLMVGKWGFGLRGGVNAILRQRLEGKLLSDAGEVLSVGQRASKVALTPLIGADISYRFLENWNVTLLAAGQQSAGVSTLAIDQPARFGFSQLQLGIRYRITR